MAFNFGTPSASTGFSFGQTKTTSAASTGFSLNTTSTASSGFSFGTNKPAATGFSTSFGTKTTSAASTGITFGSNLQTSGSSAATTSGGLFGGASLFSSTKTAPGSLSAATTNTTSLFASPATSQTKPFVGLGGTDTTAATSSQNGNNGNTTNATSQAIKDQQLPPEICKNVTDFESYVEKQKKESTEVSKFSVQSLYKIREEMKVLVNSLGAANSALQRNTSAVVKLKHEFGKQLQNAEMAKRTNDIPPQLQHDNVAPNKYFMEMVLEFETNIQMYRQQIEQLENYLNTLDQPNTLTIKDISMAICKIQESFVSIGSNLYAVHTAVQALKEQCLLYQRLVFGDTTDVFAQNKEKAPSGISSIHAGPSPFGQLGNVAALAIASVVNQQHANVNQQTTVNTQQSGLGGSLFGAKPATTGLFGNTSSLGTGFTGFGTGNNSAGTSGVLGSNSAGSLFGNTSGFGGASGFGASNNTFQLQKPPPGNNKRGKK